MKKIATLLLLVIVCMLFFVCVGCKYSDRTVQEYLSNSGNFAMDNIFVPRSAFSSTYEHISDDEEIAQQLSSFASLDFVSQKKVKDSAMEKYFEGDYGLPFDQSKWSQDMIHGAQCNKYAVKIYYENDTMGMILVDYNGTVYFLCQEEGVVFSTAKGAVDAKEFYNVD